MMRFERMYSCEHPLYEKAVGIYEANFIVDERRDADEQRRVMQDDCYHCCAVLQDEKMVGIVFYWENDAFIYLEHLCIDAICRSQGFGGRVLEQLKSQGKPVILEIEPVVDEWTAKRRHFYEQNGFFYNEHLHIQPKYHVGDSDLILWIMSSGRTLSAQEYADFREFLTDRIQIRPIKVDCVDIVPLTEEKDIPAAAELIYYSDNYIYPYMFGGVEEGKRVLTEMIKGDTLYHSSNITLAKHGDTVVGAMVAIKAPFAQRKEVYLQVFEAAGVPYTQKSERVWREYYALMQQESHGTYISNICVASRYRGNGIAGRLMSSIFDNEDTFFLECVQANAFAVRCYQRLGFVIEEPYPGFTGVPCYRMKKSK